MKLRNLFAGAMVMAAAIFSGCEPEEQLGLPDVVLGATDLEFTQEAGSQEIKVTATREWKVEYDAEWIAVTPDKGQGSNDEQTLTVTVTENTGANRTAKVTVTIGMVQKAFNVNQAGPGGATDGIESLTVKAFIEKADTENYYRLSGKVSGFNATYCSFDLTDETGKIYVYSVTDESKAEWSGKIKNGGTVVIQGKYLYYEKNSQHEVVDAIIESFTTGSADGGNDTPVDAVYYNNYDKTAATEGDKGWPYLDKFDGWKNQTGSGAEGVSYSFNGVSARDNSHSNGSYSDYDGSGMNNIFFGKQAYLATHNIALGSAVNFTLSFGTEKYDGKNKTAQFDPSEFHVWLSADGVKWVELEYAFAGTTAGRWNVASADITVPAGTEKLSICMEVDVPSVYRMDDMKLVATDKAGTAIDFSKGVSKEFGDNGDNGNASGPESKGKKTVQEFLSAADDANYYELTGVVSNFESTYCSFNLTDETGEIYVYSVLDESKTEWANKITDGGTITIYGKYYYYEKGSMHEVVDAYIVTFTEGDSGAGDNGDDNTGDGDNEGDNPGGDNPGDGDNGDGDNGDDNTGEGDTGDGDNGDDNTGDGDTGDGDTGDGDNPGGETPKGGKYVKVTENLTDWSGKYLIVYDAAAHATFNGNKDLNPTVSDLTIANGEIVSDATIDGAAVTIAKNGEYYSILLPSGKYLGAAHNAHKVSDTPYDWTLECIEDGMRISGSAENKGATNTYYMYWNSNGGNYYRCYVSKIKDGERQSGYTLPTLYKYVAE